MIAEVYIDPGDGHEFPRPLTFDLKFYTRGYVESYARVCRQRLGQTVRIVWPEDHRAQTVPSDQR
jgi:hypothetical protein